jgi:hypothetical protein
MKKLLVIITICVVITTGIQVYNYVTIKKFQNNIVTNISDDSVSTIQKTINVQTENITASKDLLVLCGYYNKFEEHESDLIQLKSLNQTKEILEVTLVIQRQYLDDLKQTYKTHCTNKEQTNSNLKITDPNIVCHLMKDEGMDMNSLGWKDYYGIGCYSHSKEIETNDVRMTLAYYVNGSDLDTVSDIKFMLNVFTEESDIQLVHTELLDAAKLLSPHIINEQLSDEVAALILRGTPGNVVINGVNIEVLKKVWPTGKGYEIQVIFK